jgi:FkbM family methyltransferase
MRLMQLIGLRYLLPRSTRTQLRDRWNNLLRWEQQLRERRFYRQFVRPGDLVFDVGANIGTKTAAFLALGAKVVALEPNPECAAEIRLAHAKAIELGRLHVECVAADAKEGTTRLHIFPNIPGMSSGSEDFVAHVRANLGLRGRVIDVPSVTLDSVIARLGKPAFVKIDAEGMDGAVLAGLQYRPRYLTFEYNTSPDLWGSTCQCFVEARRLGFSLVNITRAVVPELALPAWLDIATAPAEILRRLGSDAQWGDAIVQ